MSEPARSTALKRALAEEADALPRDFAAHVATLATARAAPASRWAGLAMLGAFIAMTGMCIAGWFAFGPQEVSVDAAPTPWLVTGIAGIAVVQLLTLRRRVLSTR
jgi:uncharacterized integral membrane protein